MRGHEPHVRAVTVARPEDVLAFWFAGSATSPRLARRRQKVWFKAGADFDRSCRQRFTATVERALAGGLRAWAREPRSRLALILVLDQLPRNIWRGCARAFAGDVRAQALARDGLRRLLDRPLSPAERLFFIMPLQHAENRALQAQSLRQHRRLLHDAGAFAPLAESALKSAREHHRIVARFGRFPHRNRALGRTSSPAERAFLDTRNRRFGQ